MYQIFTGIQYGIDLKNEAGEVVQELTFSSEAQRDAHWDALAADPDHPEWPETAVHATAWSRKTYRRPIYGVDYGPGSQKRRFGGHVPRDAYQFNGDDR